MKIGWLVCDNLLDSCQSIFLLSAYDLFLNPTDTRTLIPFLNNIEENYFTLLQYIVADAGYGSEQNYDDVLNVRKRIPLFTYNQYRKEKKKKFKNDPFKTANWQYDTEIDSFICPNNRRLYFAYESNRKDKYGFKRTFKVYESEDCTDCPLRTLCTKASEGKNRKLFYNEKWEAQKEYIRAKLLNEKTGEIYGKRKIDVEPFFGFLKANLSFTRMSVRGNSNVQNEMGFELNLRKFSTTNNEIGAFSHKNKRKDSCVYFLLINTTVFVYLRDVLSHPLFLDLS